MRLRFTGTESRTFPALRLEVAVGDVVDLDANPDGNYFEPTDSTESAAVVAALIAVAGSAGPTQEA